MRFTAWHGLLLLVIGYLLGYYFPQLAQATAGKFMPRQ